MDLLETFGDLVAGQLEHNPQRANRLFRFVLGLGRIQQKHFLDSRLTKSRIYASLLSIDAVRYPLAHPDSSAIVNIFMPCEILHTVGIHPQIAEGLSSYACGTKSEQGHIRYAQNMGIPETLCSYHKVMSGAALSGVQQKPLFIANTTLACDANLQSFRFLADHYGVEHFTIDTPNECNDEAIRYVSEQLRQFAHAAAEIVGRPINHEALCASLQCSKTSLQLYDQYLDLLSGKYLPNALTCEMYAIFMNHVLLGKPETQRYFEMLLEDVKQAAPHRKGNRILWVHTIPFWQDSMRDILNVSEDNYLLCSDMTFDQTYDFDPAQPYEAMALRILSNTFNGNFERRGEQIIARAKKLGANAMIYFCHWGCKNTIGGVEIIRQMAKDAGIAILTLDGDGCDRRNINDGQMRTRLQAFLEMLD